MAISTKVKAKWTTEHSPSLDLSTDSLYFGLVSVSVSSWCTVHTNQNKTNTFINTFWRHLVGNLYYGNIKTELFSRSTPWNDPDAWGWRVFKYMEFLNNVHNLDKLLLFYWAVTKHQIVKQQVGKGARYSVSKYTYLRYNCT